MANKNNIKIFSWNVNGLRAIQRKKALTWIDTYLPDILCLQETKLSSTYNPNQLFHKKYHFISMNQSVKKGFSGTATFSNFKANKEYFCHQIDSEFDGRIIEQHYKDFILFNVYFPNGKLNQERLDIKIKFYNNLLNYCEQLREQGYSIIICGDFNTAHKDIDLKPNKPKNKFGFSDEERKCLNKFIQKGYIDTYRYIHGQKKNAYTWWSYRAKGREKNEGWRIDYIFISEDLQERLKNAYILDCIKGSDHCPIGIEIDLDF